MAGFPIAESQLVALFMQSVTYGIHLLIFARCVWTLVTRSSNYRKPLNWPWLSVAFALFSIGTIDVSLNLYHNVIAFVFYTGQGGAEVAFDNLSTWISVIRSVWFLVGGIISDAALMYRCWAIWSHKRYIIVAPVMLWLAAIACTVAQIYYMSTLEAMYPIGEANILRPYILSYYVTTLANNLICTTLIVYRIWKVTRRSSEFFTGSFRGSGRINLAGVNRILVESATLYTVSVAATFISVILRSNMGYGLSDITLEIAGISFDLIIIRIGRGVAADQTQTFTDNLHAPAKPDVARSTRVGHETDLSDITNITVSRDVAYLQSGEEQRKDGGGDLWHKTEEQV